MLVGLEVVCILLGFIMKKSITLKPLTFYFLLFCTCFSIFIVLGSFNQKPEDVSAATSNAENKKETIVKNQDDYNNLKVFTDVIALIKRNYYREVDFLQLVQGAIKGMVATLDPHSSYLTADNFKDLKVETKGEFGGLGIEITIRDTTLTVVSPIEDSPAYRAGVMAGDQIIKIEDEFTKDMTLSDALKRMRGLKGTPVTIYIHREGRKNLLPFTIVRDNIKVKSVRFRMLDDGIGYIRLAQFQEDSSSEFISALKTLEKQNKKQLSGLVMDLRNNPGGLLTQAVRVTDLFLDGGIIVYTEGRLESNKSEYYAHNDSTEPKYPIIVLVNEGSASASEIVAGAFQDARRAVVVGAQTFGKGSVQTIIPMENDQALKLTTALYYTRSGRSIQAVGVTPDKLVATKPIQLEDLDEVAPEDVLKPKESSLKGSIRNPKQRTSDLEGNKELTISQYPKQKVKEPKYLIGSRDAMNAELSFVLSEDPQLAEGLKIIKDWIATGKQPIFDKPEASKVASSKKTVSAN